MTDTMNPLDTTINPDGSTTVKCAVRLSDLVLAYEGKVRYKLINGFVEWDPDEAIMVAQMIIAVADSIKETEEKNV